MTAGAPRYAVYFAPEPDDPWWSFGTRWLGGDPATGLPMPRLEVPGVTAAQWERVTEAPRFYGFHATLKAPFTLALRRDEEGLIAHAQTFARDRKAFALPGLRVASLGTFIALRLTADCPELDRLAADCVRDFDPWRAPPSDAETQQRRQAHLTPRELMLLEQWGYPYVLDAFRFHMTLTGSLELGEREALVTALQQETAAWAARPLPVTGICLYRQPHRQAPFRLLARVRWGGAMQIFQQEGG